MLGAAYRGGVTETAFSGVLPTVAALQAAGATALVHDPMFTDAELLALGLAPHRSGAPVAAAIIQAPTTRSTPRSGPLKSPGPGSWSTARRVLEPPR